MTRTKLTLALLCLTINMAFAQEEAFFGIHSNSVSVQKAQKLNFDQPYGAYITNVIDNTTAAREGFQPFDYIYQVDDYEFAEHTDLHDILDNYRAQESATVYFIRNGEKLAKTVTFGTREEARNRQRSDDEDPFLGIEESHKRTSGAQGVAVNIVGNSTAEKMGMEDGDVITEINGYPMIDWHDLKAAIDDLEVGDPITVTYRRGSQMTSVTNPILSLAATKGGASHGNYNDNYSYDYGQNHQTTDQNGNEEIAPVVDIADMEVDMEDMPAEEAEQMKKELGIDMPIVQNLRIEALKLFPNPTTGRFSLTFDLPNRGETSIRIFSSSGRLIYSYDLGAFSGSFSDQIDLGNEPAGTYYVMIRQGDTSVSKKVVVARV